MKYTLVTLQLINIFLAGATGGLFWKNLNLWKDQAFLGAVTSGLVFGFITLIYLGFQILLRKKTGKLLLHALIILPLFLGQCAAMVFILWQKPL